MKRNIWFVAPLAAFALMMVVLLSLAVPPIGLWGLAYGISSGDEAYEVEELVLFVKTHFQSSERPKQTNVRWLVFGVAGSKGLLEAHQQILVYYIINSIDQDRLISIVTGYLKARPHHTTDICFFESRNAITWFNAANGARGAVSGPEKQLRQVVLH